MEKSTTLIIAKLCEEIHPEARSRSEAIGLTLERFELVIKIKKRQNINIEEDLELVDTLDSAATDCFLEECQRRVG